MNAPDPDPAPLPTADLEIERLVAALPFRRPGSGLDARIAATAGFESRPVVHRMRWPAAAAALFLLGCGLAVGWMARGFTPANWRSDGVQWESAGLRDLGDGVLAGGQVVRQAEAQYLRIERFRDPATGATFEVRTIEPRLIIGRPRAD